MKICHTNIKKELDVVCLFVGVGVIFVVCYILALFLILVVDFVENIAGPVIAGLLVLFIVIVVMIVGLSWRD